jgi:hypothetical protein
MSPLGAGPSAAPQLDSFHERALGRERGIDRGRLRYREMDHSNVVTLRQPGDPLSDHAAPMLGVEARAVRNGEQQTQPSRWLALDYVVIPIGLP